MEINMEKWVDAGMRTVGKMDAEDMLALKLCLLSTGTLMGLSVKNKILRRLTGVACTVLSAGLAAPLAVRYLEELRGETPVSPIVDGTFADSFDLESDPEVTPADFEPEPSVPEETQE